MKSASAHSLSPYDPGVLTPTREYAEGDDKHRDGTSKTRPCSFVFRVKKASYAISPQGRGSQEDIAAFLSKIGEDLVWQRVFSKS
jgi:hypothetical protein